MYHQLLHTTVSRNSNHVLQRYSRAGNNGQLLLGILIVIVQLLSVWMAIGFIRSIVLHPPYVEGGQNFHVYDHLSSAKARPLMTKKSEPTSAALSSVLDSETVMDTEGSFSADDFPTCPETELTDEPIPRWMLADDNRGIDKFREQQARNFLCALCTLSPLHRTSFSSISLLSSNRICLCATVWNT